MTCPMTTRHHAWHELVLLVKTALFCRWSWAGRPKPQRQVQR